jgi:hypothetical protein
MSSSSGSGIFSSFVCYIMTSILVHLPAISELLSLRRTNGKIRERWITNEVEGSCGLFQDAILAMITRTSVKTVCFWAGISTRTPKCGKYEYIIKTQPINSVNQYRPLINLLMSSDFIEDINVKCTKLYNTFSSFYFDMCCTCAPFITQQM